MSPIWPNRFPSCRCSFSFGISYLWQRKNKAIKLFRHECDYTLSICNVECTMCTAQGDNYCTGSKKKANSSIVPKDPTAQKYQACDHRHRQLFMLIVWQVALVLLCVRFCQLHFVHFNCSRMARIGKRIPSFWVRACIVLFLRFHFHVKLCLSLIDLECALNLSS